MGLTSRRVTVGLFSATSPKPHYFSLPFQIQVKWEILRKTRVSGDSNTVAISLTICQYLWFVVGSKFSWTHKSPELTGQIYLQKQGKASAGCPSWGSVGGRKQGPGPNVTTTTPPICWLCPVCFRQEEIDRRHLILCHIFSQQDFNAKILTRQINI